MPIRHGCAFIHRPYQLHQCIPGGKCYTLVVGLFDQIGIAAKIEPPRRMAGQVWPWALKAALTQPASVAASPPEAVTLAAVIATRLPPHLSPYSFFS